MRLLKAGIAAASLSLGVGVLHTHQTDSLYPGFSIGVLVSSGILLLTLSLTRRLTKRRFHVLLAAIVTVAVLYRGYTFGFPTSLIGMDPDGYALGIERVIRAGRTDAIEVGFYDRAPLFYVLPAVLAILGDASASESMIVYPVLIGAVLPLTAAVLVRWVLGRDTYRAAGMAAIGAGVATTTVWFSYWPIAQTLALLYWCILLVSVSISAWFLLSGGAAMSVSGPVAVVVGLIALASVSISALHIALRLYA